MCRCGRILIVLAFCFLVGAQEGGLPVVIDGEEIVRIYAPLGSFTVQERAEAIEDRILALARKRTSEQITTRPAGAEKATTVVSGPLLIMTVTELDADGAGAPRELLAERYAAAIQRTIDTYRVRHTWSNLFIALLKTLLVWSGYFFGGWAVWKAVQWFRVRLEQQFTRRALAMETRGLNRLLLERGRPLVMATIGLATLITLVSGFSLALSYTFGLYPQTAGISTTLWEYLASVFRAVGSAALHYVPSGGVVVITILAAHYGLRVLRFLGEAVEHGDLSVKGLHPEMAKPTYQLVRILVVLVALVVVFPYLPGGNSEAFKGVSIFVGVLLSLGSSSAVSNVLAGVVLTYMRPYHDGDRVKIADTVGDVVAKSLLVTRVRTIKNVEVVIPNSAILSNQILNYSALARARGLILHTTVTIGYDAPWRKVHELLQRAALGAEGILHDPLPFILQTSLNDYHVSYELNAYTDRPNEIQDIYSRLHEAIQDAFNRAGVEIMSPAFHALRDGNTVTIPEVERPDGYEPRSFRVMSEAAPKEARATAHR